MSEKISDELVQRMVALVRQMAATATPHYIPGTISEAVAIVAELPAPVDPDLLIARQAAIATIANHSPVTARKIAEGNGDDYTETLIALAAIKRIRSEGQTA